MRPDDDPAAPEDECQPVDWEALNAAREPVDWDKANREDEELLLEALNTTPAGERRCRRHVPARGSRGTPGGG